MIMHLHENGDIENSMKNMQETVIKFIFNKYQYLKQ